MNSDDTKYFGVLLEEIRDQNKAVLEAVTDMQKQVSKLPKMEEDIAELKQDVKVIKAAVTDLSAEQRELDRRLTQPESA